MSDFKPRSGVPIFDIKNSLSNSLRDEFMSVKKGWSLLFSNNVAAPERFISLSPLVFPFVIRRTVDKISDSLGSGLFGFLKRVLNNLTGSLLPEKMPIMLLHFH